MPTKTAGASGEAGGSRSCVYGGASRCGVLHALLLYQCGLLLGAVELRHANCTCTAILCRQHDERVEPLGDSDTALKRLDRIAELQDNTDLEREREGGEGVEYEEGCWNYG